jgi:CheY-like chemotaxis protein
MPTLETPENSQVVVDVLVVEDDGETRTGMVELLDAAELAVAWAANGREALELIRAGVRPRLLMLDMQMPIMDGWMVLARRRKDPLLRSIPVVLTTGLDRVQVAPGEVVACLQKPTDPDRVLEIVRQYAVSYPPTIGRSHGHYLDALGVTH